VIEIAKTIGLDSEGQDRNIELLIETLVGGDPGIDGAANGPDWTSRRMLCP
jgi:hypothetical protein